jgi:hypothetical protein
MSDLPNNDEFKNRHVAMECGIVFPEGYQPYHLGQGYISHFDKGVNGLNSFSAPKNVTAIYAAGSGDRQSPPGFSYELMDKHGYFWPMPDKAYGLLLVKVL